MHATVLFRIGFAVAIALTTWLALTPRELTGICAISDKLNHFAAFAVLLLLLDFSFPGSTQPRSASYLTKVFLLLGYAVGIECLQWYLGYRTFELADIGAGTGGLLAYTLLLPVILKQRTLASIRCPRRQSAHQPEEFQ